jgi:hypothetical protein
MSIGDDISFSLKGEKEGNLDNLVDLLTNYFMFIFGFGGELGQKGKHISMGAKCFMATS